VRQLGIPCTEVAQGLGRAVVKNIVALGALQEATGLFPADTLLAAIRQALRDKSALVPLNEQAFAAGARLAREDRSSWT
jgi:2-oxoisovalerate ferredoxin oxidoreductase beta subunit